MFPGHAGRFGDPDRGPRRRHKRVGVRIKRWVAGCDREGGRGSDVAARLETRGLAVLVRPLRGSEWGGGAWKFLKGLRMNREVTRHAERWGWVRMCATEVSA